MGSQPLLTLAEVATAIGARYEGEGSLPVSGVAHPRMIQSPTEMVFAVEPAVMEHLHEIPVPVAIIPEGVQVNSQWAQKGFLIVQRPRYALAKLLDVFDTPTYREPGIHPMAVVHETAVLDPSVSVGPHVTIGPRASIAAGTVLLPQSSVGADARIGENCLIHPGARVGERVVLGNRVILQPNAVVGADGFSFVTPEQGSIESARASGGKIEAQNSEIVRINSVGTVVVEDDVEIGACTCIDRSTLGATLVRKGTKMDNLVQVGHNNVIGENCLIVSQVGIAGSCKVGNRVVLAGQVGLADHLAIADDVIVMAQSGIHKDITEKGVWGGTPALPRREFLEKTIYMGRLKQMADEMKSLQKRLAQLEAGLSQEEVSVS